jgi:tRNA/rRNA methyltransferase
MTDLRIVLVRPASAVNIGAVARVIRNTGLAGLDLVAPVDYRTVECWRTAWGATDVVEDAREFSTLAAALQGCAYAVGYSRRLGGSPSRDVRDVAEEAASLRAGQKAAFVFGPETAGLTLDELAICGRSAHIPTHAAQPSLNLSHAVMIAAYEVMRVGASGAPASPLSTHGEKERFIELLASALEQWGAVSSARRRVHLRTWRHFIHRAVVTPAEMRMLTHLARSMAAARSLRSSEAADSSAAYEDVERTESGFSIPELKWRELLFLGAVRREGDAFVRDAARPLPPFRVPDLFPEGRRFRAIALAGRVKIQKIEP